MAASTATTTTELPTLAVEQVPSRAAQQAMYYMHHMGLVRIAESNPKNGKAVVIANTKFDHSNNTYSVVDIGYGIFEKRTPYKAGVVDGFLSDLVAKSVNKQCPGRTAPLTGEAVTAYLTGMIKAFHDEDVGVTDAGVILPCLINQAIEKRAEFELSTSLVVITGGLNTRVVAKLQPFFVREFKAFSEKPDLRKRGAMSLLIDWLDCSCACRVAGAAEVIEAMLVPLAKVAPINMTGSTDIWTKSASGFPTVSEGKLKRFLLLAKAAQLTAPMPESLVAPEARTQTFTVSPSVLSINKSKGTEASAILARFMSETKEEKALNQLLEAKMLQEAEDLASDADTSALGDGLDGKLAWDPQANTEMNKFFSIVRTRDTSTSAEFELLTKEEIKLNLKRLEVWPNMSSVKDTYKDIMKKFNANANIIKLRAEMQGAQSPSK